MTVGIGIDTSFDDTAVAVVADGRKILSNLCISQFKEHEEFGGVIPERASRLHVQTIHPLLDRALDQAGVALADVDFIAASYQPGLIGSLLVGVTVGKALAMATGKPLIGVDHLEAHVYSPFMEHEDFEHPNVTLLISGANTLIYHCRDHDDRTILGGSLDDAVGECIDKCGRHLGLPMPAGPALQALALEGDPTKLSLPRPMLRSDDYDFSFSGLKTAVLYALRDDPTLDRRDVAAALLAAIADVLTVKTMRAAKAHGTGAVALTGGAAANLQIREAFRERGDPLGIRTVVPSIALCTDNAAMVAGLGAVLFERGVRSGMDLPVRATVPWR